MARVPFHRRSPDDQATSGRERRPAYRFLVLAAVIFVGLLPGAPAQATPSVDEIEAQLDKQWEQLEPTVEQFNKVRSELKANQKKAAQLQKQIKPLAAQVEVSLDKVGDLASRYYKSGPASRLNAMLATGSANDLTQQLALLDRIARQEQADIADVTTALNKYESQKRKLDELIEKQRKQDAELAAKKKQIDADMRKLEQQRLAAYGSSSSGGALRIGPCPAVYIGGPAGSKEKAAGIAVRAACAQIGKPYVWGATGPNSFDCSGLTQYVWAKAGVHLTHFTGAQWREGTPVSRANARPGDLVFFFNDLHHVGMYVGNGIMVHSPTTGKDVQMARIDNMPVAGFRRP